MSFMFTSGAHVGSAPRNPSYRAYDYEEIEREYSYNAGYRAAKEEYEDELDSWRDDVEKLMAKLKKAEKELQDEREKRLYLEHIVEELQDQATEVDVDPHLLDRHFADASDAYERLFNEPMED